MKVKKIRISTGSVISWKRKFFNLKGELKYMFRRDFLYSISLPKIQTYFLDTFVKVLDTNEHQFFYRKIVDVSRQRDDLLFKFDSHSNSFVYVKDQEFDFSFPQTGYYDFKDSCFLFSRTSIRQNRKGLCQDTGNFSNLKYYYYQKLDYITRTKIYWNMEENILQTVTKVNGIFFPRKQKEIPQKVKEVVSQKIFSRSLSKDFALSQGIESKHPSLWFKSFNIGELQDEKVMIIHNDLFYQEAVDVFSNLYRVEQNAKNRTTEQQN